MSERGWACAACLTIALDARTGGLVVVYVEAGGPQQWQRIDTRAELERWLELIADGRYEVARVEWNGTHVGELAARTFVGGTALCLTHATLEQYPANRRAGYR